MGKQGPPRGEIKHMHGRMMKTSKTAHVAKNGNA